MGSSEFNTKITSEIRNYYSTHEVELPYDYRHRYFKFVWKYPTQRAMHIRDIITSEKHLRSLAIKYAPQHVYYSLTRWLDPTTVHGRDTPAVPLWSDVVIDIDSDNIRSAIATTRRLYMYLKDTGYSMLKVLFTGTKGFHIYVKDFAYSHIPMGYKSRAKLFEREKKRFLYSLYGAGFNIDTNLWDLYRVVRVPGTLNATTMLPARWVDIDHITEIDQPTKVIPDKPETTYLHTFLVSSHVLGTADRHVLFLDYDYRDYSAILSEVRDIQDKYHLNEFILLRTTKGYNVWFFDALQFKQVIRIKRNTTEDGNHIDYMKTFGYDVARVGPKYSVHGDQVAYQPAPTLELVGHPEIRKNPLVSLGHWNLARNAFGADLGSPDMLNLQPIGSDSVKIIFASQKVPKK